MEPGLTIDKLEKAVSASLSCASVETDTGVTSTSKHMELEPGVSMPAGPPELVSGLAYSVIVGSVVLVHGVSVIGRIFLRFTEVAPSLPQSASLLI